VNYQRKQKGWARAAKKFNTAHPPAHGLRMPSVTFEQRLEMAVNQERRAVALRDALATRRNEKHANLVGREFDRLFVWQTVSVDILSPVWGCLCACGSITAEVAAHRLLAGEVTDCGCLEAEAQRIQRHRKSQRTKLRAKEARAYRRVWGIAA
jgi:hypothetical protein